MAETMSMYLQDRMLVRPRVYQLLREAAGLPLCTVTAGSGYGKSRTVSSFLQMEQVPYVWVQLTDMDNYIPRFWEIISHAVSSAAPDLSLRMRGLGFPGTPELLYKFVKTLRAALEGAPKLYIVLDDFHHIEEPAIVRLLETVADADFENLSLFVLSRQPVPLDYFSLFNNGLLYRVDENDLRFTYEEIEAYYSLLKFDFVPMVLTNVFESTEGWPLALYLIGLHEANHSDHKKDPVAYTMPFLNSLFEVELFSAYTPAVQKAFVRLSLLSAVPLDLVRAIAGEGFDEVYKALQSNMFMIYNASVDNQFVFHRLFRRFLKPRRDALSLDERNEVYNLAGDWYYRQNRYSGALTYYRKSDNTEGQWAVMQHYAQRDFTPEISAHCIGLAESFPPEFVAQNPMVPIHKGYMYLTLGRIDDSAKTFEGVLKEVEGKTNEESLRRAGEAWLGLAPVRLYQRRWDFAECFANAVRLLPEGSACIGPENHYLGNANALMAFSRAEGEVDAMAEKLSELWGPVSRTMNGCGSGMGHLVLTEAAFYRCDFDRATQQAHQALYVAVENGQRDIACASYYFLVRIYYALGDFNKIMHCLAEMDSYLQGLGSHHAWGVDGIARAWFYQRVGDFEAIPSWVYGEPLPADGPNIVAVSREKVVETGRLIREGRYEEALARIDTLLAVYDRQGAIFSYLKSFLQKAVCLLRLGREEEAAQVFRQVCIESMPNDIRMTLVEEGEDTVVLTDLLREMGGEAMLLAWLEPVARDAAAYAETSENMRQDYSLQLNGANG